MVPWLIGESGSPSTFMTLPPFTWAITPQPPWQLRHAVFIFLIPAMSSSKRTFQIPKLIGFRFPAMAGLKGYNQLKTFMILLGIQNISHNPTGGTTGLTIVD
jgi:hypothetical protein